MYTVSFSERISRRKMKFRIKKSGIPGETGYEMQFFVSKLLWRFLQIQRNLMLDAASPLRDAAFCRTIYPPAAALFPSLALLIILSIWWWFDEITSVCPVAPSYGHQFDRTQVAPRMSLLYLN